MRSGPIALAKVAGYVGHFAMGALAEEDHVSVKM